MATLPTIDRRVTPNALPDVRRTAALTPEAAGVGTAEAQAQFAGTAEKIGLNEAETMAAEAKKTAAQLETQEAENTATSLKINLLTDPKNGALQRQGKQAADFQDVLQTYDEQTSKIADGLKTDPAKVAFEGISARERNNLLLQLNTHADQQMKVFDAQEFKTGIENAQATAQLSVSQPGDPKTQISQVGQQRDLIIQKVAEYAARNGWGPEETAARRTVELTKLHVGVVEQMLAQDQSKQAQTYFDEVKDQLAGGARVELAKALDSAGTDREALHAATAIWTSLGPKDDEQPVELDKMVAAAREKYADDPKLFKAARTFLEDQARDTEAGRAQRDTAMVSTIYQAIAKGATRDDIHRLTAYRQAPGRVQTTVDDYLSRQAEHVANQAYLSSARAAAEASRQYTNDQRAEAQRNRVGAFQYFQLLDHVHEMTDDQIWASAPQIGLENATRLLEARRKAIADPKTIDDFRTDKETIDGVLERSQIDPNPGKDDLAGRANIGWFYEQVAAEQRRVQDITKKKVTRDELAAIAKRILGVQVLEHHTFWFDSSKNIVQATISDVPAADQTAIKASFVKRGITDPTDQQILDVWRERQIGRK